MLLGLILERIKPGSEVLNLVLEGRRRTGDIRLNGRWWRGGVDRRWMGGQPHLGSPHTCQIRLGMLSIPPHSKVHDLSHKQLMIEECPTYHFLLRWP